ncbi:MAG: dihydroorotate dehydrogenase electron transfer subunit, partial [Bacillota bacterium]
IGRMIAKTRPDVVWACGPAGMYRALREKECLEGIACQVSLEERMGCGVGACLTCSCRIRTEAGWEYKRVCADGPVFSLEEVVFDGE